MHFSSFDAPVVVSLRFGETDPHLNLPCIHLAACFNLVLGLTGLQVLQTTGSGLGCDVTHSR
jgi:hypothetical protein